MDGISISPPHPVCDQPPGPPAREAERSLRDGAGSNWRARILNILCVLIKRLSAVRMKSGAHSIGALMSSLCFQYPKVSSL